MLFYQSSYELIEWCVSLKAKPVVPLYTCTYIGEFETLARKEAQTEKDAWENCVISVPETNGICVTRNKKIPFILVLIIIGIIFNIK